MRYMTALEKMDLLTKTPSENIHEVQERLIDGTLTDEGRPIVRVDLRGYIRRRMAEEGITCYRMATFLGKAKSNFSSFINGKIPFPLDDIERMLWVLDGKAEGDEEDTVRILRQDSYEKR